MAMAEHRPIFLLYFGALLAIACACGGAEMGPKGIAALRRRLCCRQKGRSRPNQWPEANSRRPSHSNHAWAGKKRRVTLWPNSKVSLFSYGWRNHDDDQRGFYVSRDLLYPTIHAEILKRTE